MNTRKAVPLIRSEEDEKTEYYRGMKADCTFCDVKNRGHGQAIDEANRGEIPGFAVSGACRTLPMKWIRQGKYSPEHGSVALADGRNYVQSERQALPSDRMCALSCASLQFLALCLKNLYFLP